MKILRQENKPLKFNVILNKAGYRLSEKNNIRAILESLIKNDKIEKSGKFYTLKEGAFVSEIQTGIVEIGNNERFIINYKGKEINVKSNPGISISSGDKIEFIISKKKKTGKEFAKVMKVINKEIKSITGRLELIKKNYFVIPDSRQVKKDILIQPANINKSSPGDKVVCEILNYDDLDSPFIELEGRILEILGEAGEKDVELLSVLKKYGFSVEFPSNIEEHSKSIGIKAKEELESLPKPHARRKLFGDRIDLRKTNCFTIDPINAKDFDDAVSIEKTSEGYKLGVHIADVSNYVKEGSETDIEALKRGTSVYLVDMVAPMLPEILSNDICSLKEGVDRYTFSVFIYLTAKGKVTNYEIFKAIINSNKRFSYEEAQEILDGKNHKYAKELLTMYELSKMLTSLRMKDGSIDFDTPEVKFILDENGDIAEIKAKERLDSMKLIEEFMLLANKCVTEFVTGLSLKYQSPFPFVYRVHDLPDKDKLADLSRFIRQFGYSINLEDKKSIVNLTAQIKGKPEEYVINNLLLRSMAKAVYTPENIGHYGLGFKDYTHFTSPIRRYPDLIVHRILYDYLNTDSEIERKKSHYRKILGDVCKQSSAQEQAAVNAERETIKIKQVEYLSHRLGKEFEGIISGIINYGMFVELDGCLIEGLIRFRNLEDDYYEYNEKEYYAVGVRRGRKFYAGQKVRVKVISCDLESRKIDFSLVTDKSQRSISSQGSKKNSHFKKSSGRNKSQQKERIRFRRSR